LLLYLQYQGCQSVHLESERTPATGSVIKQTTREISVSIIGFQTESRALMSTESFSSLQPRSLRETEFCIYLCADSQPKRQLLDKKTKTEKKTEGGQAKRSNIRTD
jgi:hypothetical protein